MSEKYRPKRTDLGRTQNADSETLSVNISLVPLPERHLKYAKDIKDIHPDDLAFFDTLLEKYGLSSRHEETQVPFDEDEFFGVAREMQEYAYILRADEIVPEIPESTLGLSMASKKMAELLDRRRPSSKRMTKLSKLFLFQPRIRHEYNKVHAKKMVAAYPLIQTWMQDDQIQSSQDVDEYMLGTSAVLSAAMEKGTSQFSVLGIDAVGTILGFEQQGMLLTSDRRRSYFAHTGLSVFTSHLGAIIKEAVSSDQSVKDVIRREFLEKDGVVFQAMRTSLHDNFHRIEPEIVGMTQDERRRFFETNDFEGGACAALLKMPTDVVVPEDGERQRPISYEIALAIADSIPQHICSSELVQKGTTAVNLTTGALDDIKDRDYR